MSRIAVRNALSKFRDGYFRLEINQRLYVNAMIMLFIAFIVSAIFKPQDSKGALILFLVFWISAICYDLISLYKKIYSSVLGKGFLLILFSLCTNFAIVLSSQLVNDISGVDPSKFPHTIALLAILSKPFFIAAGFGSRLAPITFNTPTPLVRVKGKRIIDSLLDAVIAQGITEIYIVRGYLGEQFDQLLYKYPMIKFIENPVYNEANNISSAYCASYLLKNAYVMEADLLLYNPSLITKYQYSSNYLGVPVDKKNDWCLYTDGGRVTKMAIGGFNCYHMFGISYWTEEDGAKLVEDIKDVYQAPGGKERYWDQVALEYHIDNYNVSVRECSFSDIIEIDTFNELKKIDKTYDM